MKQWMLLLLMVMVLCVGIAAAEVESLPEGRNVGGWTMVEDSTITEELKALVDKATEGMDTVYTPVALLNTQLVSGMNYCFLCRTGKPDSIPAWSLVYIHADLSGNAEIMNVYELYIDKHASSM